MKKILLIISAIIILTGCEVDRPKPKVDLDNLKMSLEANYALQEAKLVFQQAMAEEVDMTNGPCLSNSLFGNPDYPETYWVLDIAHEPRQEVDNLPENQCSAYLEGRAHNFIEMDQSGKVLKLYSPLLIKQAQARQE